MSSLLLFKKLLKQIRDSGYYEIIYRDGVIHVHPYNGNDIKTRYIANVCINDRKAIESFMRKLRMYGSIIAYFELDHMMDVLKVRGKFVPIV